jgi:hypothetical protein
MAAAGGDGGDVAHYGDQPTVPHTDVGAGYGNSFAPMMTANQLGKIAGYYTQAPRERSHDSIRNVTQAALAFSMGSHARTLPVGTGPIEPDMAIGGGQFARVIEHARSLVGGTRLVVGRANGAMETVTVYDNFTAEFPLDLSKLTYFGKDTNGVAYDSHHRPHAFNSTFNYNAHPAADYSDTVNRLIWDAAASASVLHGDNDLSTAFPVLKPVNSGAQYELLMGFLASIPCVHTLVEESSGNLCLNDYATSAASDDFQPAFDPAFYVPLDGAPAYVIVLPIKLLFQHGDSGGWRKGTDVVDLKEIMAFASKPDRAIDIKFEPLAAQQHVPVLTDYLGMIGDTKDLALRFYPSGLVGFYDKFVAQEASIGALLDSHGTDLAMYPAQYGKF